VDHVALIVSDEFYENQSEWGGYTVTPPHMATALEEAVSIMAGPVASSIENGEDIKSREDFGSPVKAFYSARISKIASIKK
jgi:hypothetical protein